MANRNAAVKVLWLVHLCLLAPSSVSEATWSIVGVDPRTREVGSAGASCTQFAAGIVALAPGHGVLVDQAVSNGPARRLGIEMMVSGSSPAEIIAAMSDAEVRDDFERGQLGVVTLEHSDRPAAFTGRESSAWRGHQLAPGFSVQGNVLVNEAVVAAAHRTYVAADGSPLAERLIVALEAGAAEGGDERCGDQTALSAYLVVAAPEDRLNSASRAVITPYQRSGGENPVLLLRRLYEQGDVRSVRLLPSSGEEFLWTSVFIPPLAAVLCWLLIPSLRRGSRRLGLGAFVALPPIVFGTSLVALSAAGFVTGVWREAVTLLLAANALSGALAFAVVTIALVAKDRVGPR